MNKRGYLEGSEMATTFNMLRANDLIWSFVVNNYLLGNDPFPFDLLYWNADSTRMPARMHSFYLRKMYQENLLAEPGGISLAGVPIDLRKIKTPAYFLSTREDHIAPWKSTYRGTQLLGGPKRFVLAASGHIAGVVNPPDGGKYSHWINTDLPPDPEDWFKGATEIAGSWWPDWHRWVTRARQGAGAGARARRRQAEADRGRAGQLREGAAELVCWRIVPPSFGTHAQVSQQTHARRLSSGLARRHRHVQLLGPPQQRQRQRPPCPLLRQRAVQVVHPERPARRRTPPPRRRAARRPPPPGRPPPRPAPARRCACASRWNRRTPRVDRHGLPRQPQPRPPHPPVAHQPRRHPHRGVDADREADALRRRDRRGVDADHAPRAATPAGRRNCPGSAARRSGSRCRSSAPRACAACGPARRRCRR